MAKISRRDFFTGVGVGGVGVAAGVAYDQVIRRPMEMLVPQVIPPED